MQEEEVEIMASTVYVKGTKEGTAYKITPDAATRNDNVYEKLTEKQKRLLEANGYFIVTEPKIVTLKRNI